MARGSCHVVCQPHLKSIYLQADAKPRLSLNAVGVWSFGGQDIEKEVLRCWSDAGHFIAATPKIEKRAALRFSKFMQNTGVGKQLAAAT